MMVERSVKSSIYTQARRTRSETRFSGKSAPCSDSSNTTIGRAAVWSGILEKSHTRPLSV